MRLRQFWIRHPPGAATMITRRESLGALGAGSALLLGLDPRQAGPGNTGQSEASAPAHAGKHELRPLPFDPKTLKGLSEKLIVSHHENNYGGAVKNLNKVEAALGQLTKDSPAFLVAGLKERQLTFSNSVTLHELYFGNLGGDGKPAGEVAKALGEAYGSLARWEEEFRATGMALSGGSGWVMVDLDLATKDVRTYWSGNHTQARASSMPLLVMDLYEHAYQMDYGAAAAKYIDAIVASLRWEEVERRFALASKAANALRGA
jgi:Fe-Mn family superoxide dismutase